MGDPPRPGLPACLDWLVVSLVTWFSHPATGQSIMPLGRKRQLYRFDELGSQSARCPIDLVRLGQLVRAAIPIFFLLSTSFS